MPRCYSDDLRWRAVRANEEGERSQAEIAEFFGISLPGFCRCWKKYGESGEASTIRNYY